MSGAFQTSREIFDSPIWKNIVDFRLFFLIYGNAVFSDQGVKLADDLTLERGQWCRSTRKLQEDLQYIENRQIKTYSTSVINRCIKRLEALQMICTRTHQLGTVFTVVNYNKYQGLHNYQKSNLEQNLEQTGNSGGTVGEQSGNNNKKVKNDNNDKKEEIKDIGQSNDSPSPTRFIPPTIEQVTEYCQERNNDVDPNKWIDHYTSKGWIVGKAKMKDWKAAVRTWERNDYG